MKRYEQQRAILRRIIRAKAARRRELASLPIEEKIRIVIELQKMESSIRQATGRPWRAPWRIEPWEGTDRAAEQDSTAGVMITNESD